MSSLNPRQERKWTEVVQSVISESASFVALAAKEWLPALVDQPNTPPFRYNAAFKDEFQRVARLIVFVIVLSLIILGSLTVVLKDVATLHVIKVSLKALVVGFIVAICYQPFAYIFGVRVAARNRSPRKPLSLRQILFSVLYTTVPWVPIFAFLWVVTPATSGSVPVFLVTVFWICCLYVVYNFVKAIALITECSRWRIWPSIAVPILAFITFVLFI